MKNYLLSFSSISMIELTKSIEHFSTLSEIFGTLFQVVIGVLTVIKLTIDLKNNLKNKNHGKK